MAKGNNDLIRKVDEGIAKLKQKGTFKEIENRWLGAAETAEKSDSDTNTKQVN